MVMMGREREREEEEKGKEGGEGGGGGQQKVGQEQREQEQVKREVEEEEEEEKEKGKEESSPSELLQQSWDIVIVGTGAAGLTAALEAATTETTSQQQGEQKQKRPLRILLLEKAPLEWGAGGNGYFTAAAYRTQHSGLRDILPLVSNVRAEDEDEEVPKRDKEDDETVEKISSSKIDLPPYSASDFQHDLQRVTQGQSDAALGEIVIRESLELVQWLKRVGGVDWWLSFRRQAYQIDGRWKFWGGLCLTVKEGGKGLIRDLLGAVKRQKGCEICFGSEVKKLVVDDDSGAKIKGVEVEMGGRRYQVQTRNVILAAGGFEASPELRKKWMGPGWERAHTRGTPYNTGDMLLAALDVGAKRVGDFSPTGCHSVAWDADSPKNGGDREKTNEFTKSGYPLGLMLNTHGRRFVDEGVDLRNYTYAKFGRAILEQPQSIAFQVWDREGQQWLRAEEYRDEIVQKVTADSIEELARKLHDDHHGLQNAGEFVQTIHEYNSAVAAHRAEYPHAQLNPAVRDQLSTQSTSVQLELPKSNWAVPIRTPPFLAVVVTSGITFTFGGLAINPENGAVLRADHDHDHDDDGGSEMEGLYCVGEMVGGLFYHNYPGGAGLTAGGVFGRRAGRAAAVAARVQQGMD